MNVVSLSSELSRSRTVDIISLIDQLVNCFCDHVLGSVIEVESALDAELVSGHDGGLGVRALAHDEGQVWVGGLDSFIVVDDVVTCAVARRGAMAENESQFFNTSFDQITHFFTNYYK